MLRTCAPSIWSHCLENSARLAARRLFFRRVIWRSSSPNLKAQPTSRWSSGFTASGNPVVDRTVVRKDPCVSGTWGEVAQSLEERCFRSKAADVDHSLGESLRSFLRQIVADAAGDEAVLIFARELIAIRRAGRVDCTVGVAFHGDRGHGDGRKCGQPLFQVVIFPLAVGQAKPPAIVVHHDVNMVGVVEGRCCAVVRGIVEIPLWRSLVPDELIELVEVFRIAGLADWGGEIVLVPEQERGLGWPRHLVARRAADQIAADGNDRLAAFRPECCHDVRRARAPVKAGDGSCLDLERIHQSDDVEGDGRLLGVPERVSGKKARRTVAAQIGNDYPVACRSQQRSDVDKTVNVVRPAMEKNDRGAIWPGRLPRIRC